MACWVKCSKRLALNNVSDLNRASGTLVQILEKILDNPLEDKYRRINTTKALFKSNISEVTGASDFLSAIGFEKLDEKTTAGIKFIFLPQLADEREVIEKAISWIKKVTSANLLIRDEGNCIGESCAECIIQLRFPTGHTEMGGFQCNDTLSILHAFASSFYEEAKLASHELKLKMPHDIQAFNEVEELMGVLTMKEFSLSGRSLLLVTLQEKHQAGGAGDDDFFDCEG